VKAVLASLALLAALAVGLPVLAQNAAPPAGQGTAPVAGQPATPAAGQKLTLTKGYTLTDADIELIKAGVLAATTDPASARFSEIRAMSDNYGNVAVCGFINAKNEAGLRTGNTPFTGTLAEAPARNPDGSLAGPPASGFNLIAVGGEACERCMTFGARNLPSIACWSAEGRGVAGPPKP
jgi:hypothetical protein